MKDQILTVEPHDDLASLRDKILRTQAERILLLPPSPSSLRRLDLALCARWADAAGASLCLVSSQVSLTHAASSAGVASYATLDEAIAAEDRPPEAMVLARPPSPPGALDAGEVVQNEGEISATCSISYAVAMRKLRGPGDSEQVGRQRLAAIGKRAQEALFLAPLALLATSALLLLPHADVDIALPMHASPRVVPIVASSASLIAAEAVAEGAMLSTGSAVVPTAFAEGELSLTNRSDRVLAIPPGTRFRDPASGAEFEALSGGWLDPQASARVGIRAVEPGRQGNLAAGRIREVVGDANGALEVRQDAPTTGGQFTTRAVVTAADIASVRSQTHALVVQRLREALRREASTQGGMLVDGTFLIRGQEESFSESAGAAVDEVHMTINAEAESLFVPQEVVLARARQALGAVDDADTLNLAELRVEKDARGVLSILFSTQEFTSSIPLDLAVDLANRTPAGALRIIAGQLPTSRTTIQLWPTWWPLLPAYPIRIHIERLAAPESSQAPRTVAGGVP